MCEGVEERKGVVRGKMRVDKRQNSVHEEMKDGVLCVWV